MSVNLVSDLVAFFLLLLDKEPALTKLAKVLSRDVLQKTTNSDDILPGLLDYINASAGTDTAKTTKTARKNTAVLHTQKTKKRKTVSFMDMLSESQPGGTNLIDTWKIINQDGKAFASIFIFLGPKK